MPELNNKVQLTGHLGSNPDIRVTDKGKKHARFSLATNEFYRNSNGDTISNTYWHNLVAWGKVADIAEKYLDKGSEVVIEGKLVNRNYNGKDGNKKFITEVQINEMLLLGEKKKKL